MANEKYPGMVTGANAVIKIGNTTMAYSYDVNYTIDIPHLPIEVMNKYENITNEPVGYYISGSFTILRYTIAAKNANLTEQDSNSPQKWTTGDNKMPLQNQLNPGKILSSQTVDIVLYQRYYDGSQETSVEFLKLKNCRLTNRSASVNKNSHMTERFDFVGELASDDFLIANGSGFEDLS
jgi:hypothetical protein